MFSQVALILLSSILKYFAGYFTAEARHIEPSKGKKAGTKSQQNGISAVQGKQEVRKLGDKAIFCLQNRP